MLRKHGMPLESAVPLLVDLLAVPLGPRYSVVEGTPERRKQKTIEAIVELMLAASESQPLLDHHRRSPLDRSHDLGIFDRID